MLRIVAAGPHAERVLDLGGLRYSVGRGYQGGDPHVDIVVPCEDKSLSRLHFTLVRDGASYAIQNDSEAGTFVNGRELGRMRGLKPRDRNAAGNREFEFLVLTDRERAVALGQEVGAIEEPRAAAAPRTPLHKRPVFFAVLAFYGLLALVIAAATAKDADEVPDPGPGPYLVPLLGEVVADTADVDQSKVTRAQRAHVEATWARAMREHGGDLLPVGTHAFELVRDATILLRGWGTGYWGIEDALRRSSDATPKLIATEGKRVLQALDDRLKRLHAQAGTFWDAQQYAQALPLYEEIVVAMPDRSLPIHVFALSRIRTLKGG
jgi:hypothetical protein